MADTLEILIVGKDQASGPLGKVSNALDSLGGVATGLATAGLAVVASGIAALSAGIVSSIGAAMEAQDGLAALNAVIASTKGIAGVTAEEALKLASSFQDITRFSDDTILKGEQMLLTFTNIGKDVFPQATEAMVNMGQEFGSIDQAAIQLGKALNDPIAGVGALSRIGIKLNETQQESIKHFMEMGDIAGAQRVILGELETQFGGLAEAAGSTAAGKFDILKNKIGDIQEQIGGAFLPVLTLAADKISSWVDSPGFQAGVNAVVNGIQQIMDIITPLSSGETGLALQNFQHLLMNIGFTPEQITSITGSIDTIAISAGQIGEAFGKMIGGTDISALSLITSTLEALATAMEKIAAASETVQQLGAIFEKVGVGGGIAEIAKAGGVNSNTGLMQAGLGLAPAAQMAGSQGFQSVQGATGGAPGIDWAALGNAIVSAFQSAPPPMVTVNANLDGNQIANSVSVRLGSESQGLNRIGGHASLR